MSKDLKISKHNQTFDSIKHLDNNGNEFWQARELAKIIGYSQYRDFIPVIERAKAACNSGHDSKDHIEDLLTMVKLGSGIV